MLSRNSFKVIKSKLTLLRTNRLKNTLIAKVIEIPPFITSSLVITGYCESLMERNISLYRIFRDDLP